MARVPQVTRTIITTQCNVMCLNIKTGEPENRLVILSGTYKDEKHLMKALEKVINNDEVKAVHCVHKEEVETLYGMTEQDFIEHAKVLPKREAKENKEN